MDELIIKMMQNRGCERLEKGFQACLLILGGIALLLAADILIAEICYDESFWKTMEGIFVFIIIFIIFIKMIMKYNSQKKKNISLECNKKLVQAKFNAEEFQAIGFLNQRHICSYYLVGYYVEGTRTYKFESKIYDRQASVCNVFKSIDKRGKFPETINVYVDSTNYQNYQMQVYEFLDETLKINQELVEKEYYHVR